MKKILVAIMLCISVVISTVGCSTRKMEEDKNKSVYNGLFDDSYVHKIDVTISDEDWSELLETPGQKTKYKVSVTIDGNKMDSVSFATKGNLSLEQVGFSDSERYSFKIIFDKFVKDQTYDGLDKLNLQNTHADATYMKDYITYAMMREAGVAAPLASYVELSINGQVHGLYLAVEDLDESFLKRNYGEDYGALYKPEDEGRFVFNNEDVNIEIPEEGIPLDGQGDDTMEENMEAPAGEEFLEPSAGENNPEEMGELEAFEVDMQSYKGADLSYIDDSLDSYIDIFNNNQTQIDDAAKTRLIKALKTLSEGKDLDSCVDLEAMIRYFVVHNFVLNSDSYTGYAPHNYGLYEKDGKLTMLPWDYNFAFCKFGGNDANMLINYPIDTPLAMDDAKRPMWTNLMNKVEILDQYHKVFDEFLSDYFDSGRFEEQVNRVYKLIRDYVDKDPSAWYTVEEFDVAVETLKTFCKLRAQSIQGQLDGTIPSTKQGQQENAESLISVGDLNVNAMGSEDDLMMEFDDLL